MTTRSKTMFTVDEANRTLPLVRSIVGDVAERWNELVRVREEYGNSSPEHDRIMRELAEYIQELKAIGCHLKDFEHGLVDFPSVIEGQEVQLSWKLGETEITHMFAGDGETGSRVPLPEKAEPSQN
ncbi:MAG TPA: DUF2203 domain-containing protein [bacterium]|nr:DUF2203 domain-containing protein [bacterium]